MKMIEMKKLLIILLAIICILIALGAYLNSNSSTDTNISSEDNITVNDSIADIANPDENGTVWLEENGTLTEAKVTESTGNGSASS
jgi:septal ring-binding cell division protein DamX